MTLREIIKELCKENDMTVNKLEEELDFARGYVSKLDKSVPNSAKIMQIADYFDVTTDFLLGRTAFKNPIDALEDIPLDLLKHYQEQDLSSEEMNEAYADFRKAEKEDLLYEQENAELTGDIRAAARDLMGLPKAEQKLAFDMIKMMAKRGKEAKDNGDT